MSEEDYHKYMSEVHAPLVRDLMAQYGIVSWEMVIALSPICILSRRKIKINPRERFTVGCADTSRHTIPQKPAS
jgi:hypothetical protein